MPSSKDEARTSGRRAAGAGRVAHQRRDEAAQHGRSSEGQHPDAESSDPPVVGADVGKGRLDWLTARLNWRVGVIALVTALIPALSLILGVDGIRLRADEEARFLSPSEQTVPEGFFPHGTLQEAQEGSQIWLLNVPHSTRKIYPPLGDCDVSPDLSWTCARYFLGGPSDAGESYDLILVAADAGAVQMFMDYHQADNGSYRGMTSFPEGVRELASITVTRR